VEELVALGRAFARIEDGRVVFKAEIGAATSEVCQVQGVWVQPSLRGQGMGTAGTASVVNLAREDVAPVVSLYVNDYNRSARASYERVGFRQVGTFASVLF
jgi:predicted GNAT family acetyltransferase